jgi:hypothetical protein
MIRTRVLGQQASHLLLIHTNLGYGTVLTAACARQCCSVSDLVLIHWLLFCCIEANYCRDFALCTLGVRSPHTALNIEKRSDTCCQQNFGHLVYVLYGVKFLCDDSLNTNLGFMFHCNYTNSNTVLPINFSIGSQ